MGIYLLTKAFFIGSFLLPTLSCARAVTVGELRCEFLKTPLGIDNVNPALSWTIQDERRGVTQVGYRLLVASSKEMLAENRGDLWDSGEVASDQSHLVTYAGKVLRSRQRCFWKVLVKTVAANGKSDSSGWSAPSWWEMGLLSPSDWQGSWIQSAACEPIDNDITRLWTRQTLVPQELNPSPLTENEKTLAAAQAEGERLIGSILPSPIFRSSFTVPGSVKRARLYITGLAFQEAFINGTAVSDRMFDPTVTYYQKRGGYVTHDVTAIVKEC